MINTKQHGGPAFPTERQLDGAGDLFVAETFGMTLRDYFAAKAMAALLASREHKDSVSKDWITETAYWMADAMLTERSK